MAGLKKPTFGCHSSHNSVNVNPLTEINHNLNNNDKNCNKTEKKNENKKEKEEEGGKDVGVSYNDNKENRVAVANGLLLSSDVSHKNQNLKSLSMKENGGLAKEVSGLKSLSTGRVLKPTSLQLCMQMSDNDKSFGSRVWDHSDHSTSLNIWEYSDSEAAPASSWSTLPNRALLCKQLPIDVGRCTCVIVKEPSPEGSGGSIYALYTNEGRGRKDRKLAVASHKRRNGKSEFSIAQNIKGLVSNSDDSCVGNMTANLVGSKYHIWDQVTRNSGLTRQTRSLVSVVKFTPTISTWTGSYRNISAYIPKHKTVQLKNLKQGQYINRLPNDWQGNTEEVQKLCSRTPQYNKMSKKYELDYRDRGRGGLRIKSSVKNFQLTLEENGRHTILQMGRIDKLKYVIDFRYPLTGYQAFSICLASIDSKLCCAM